ncbi:large ribosomal subunit protein mL41-like [Lytechinus pictus]|uniref:large ribosomal subunit protein mL41-like n=1 Tax=Lytechinus pictus TaxID=7653 RepID=UPI0030BA246A
MPVLRNLLRGFTRGANRHKEMTSKRGNKNFHPNTSRIQPTGYGVRTTWRNVKEMIPEIVVPSLDDFPLKAYVSYKCPDTQQDPITPRDIFDKCVAPRVLEDLESGKYDSEKLLSSPASEGKS